LIGGTPTFDPVGERSRVRVDGPLAVGGLRRICVGDTSVPSA